MNPAYHFPGVSGAAAPFMQWLLLLPVWSVFLGGAIVAVVFWKHCPRPAMLTLLALLIITVVAVVQPILNSQLVHERAAHAWTSEQLGFRLLRVRGVANLFNALGYTLLLTAIFTGRRPAAPVQPPALPTNPQFL